MQELLELRRALRARAHAVEPRHGGHFIAAARRLDTPAARVRAVAVGGAAEVGGALLASLGAPSAWGMPSRALETGIADAGHEYNASTVEEDEDYTHVRPLVYAARYYRGSMLADALQHGWAQEMEHDEYCYWTTPERALRWAREKGARACLVALGAEPLAAPQEEDELPTASLPVPTTMALWAGGEWTTPRAGDAALAAPDGALVAVPQFTYCLL